MRKILSFVLSLALAVTLSPMNAFAALTFDENYNPDVVVEYDPDLYDPEHDAQDMYDLLFQEDVMEQILAEAGFTRDEYGNLVFPDKDWAGSVDIDIRPGQNSNNDDGDDSGAECDDCYGPYEAGRYWTCNNAVSYSIADVKNPRYELLRPSVVFVDREAQFRFVATVEYNIHVDQECEETIEWSDGTTSKGSKKGDSKVVATLVYDQNGQGYDEFHARSLVSQDPNIRVMPLIPSNGTFRVWWNKIGEKPSLGHGNNAQEKVMGVVVLNDITKFKKLDDITFPSDWKGIRPDDMDSDDKWNVTYTQTPIKLTRDIDNNYDVDFVLTDGKRSDVLNVQGFGSQAQ